MDDPLGRVEQPPQVGWLLAWGLGESGHLQTTEDHSKRIATASVQSCLPRPTIPHLLHQRPLSPGNPEFFASGCRRARSCARRAAGRARAPGAQRGLPPRAPRRSCQRQRREGDGKRAERLWL
eukprot:gene12004-biopygen12452